MKRLLSIMLVLALVASAALPLLAESAKKDSKQATMPMPEMGAPKQTKEMIAGLVGDWKVHYKSKMDPTAKDWTESDGESSYEVALDSCALLLHSTGTFMGMTMKGLGVLTFNRETGRYQQYWVDNFAGQASFYEGDKDKTTGDYLYTGTDMMMGKKFFTKMTVHISDPKTMLITFDQSADGKTYARTMELSCTKK